VFRYVRTCKTNFAGEKKENKHQAHLREEEPLYLLLLDRERERERERERRARYGTTPGNERNVTPLTFI
jgi:hypothetical protein